MQNRLRSSVSPVFPCIARSFWGCRTGFNIIFAGTLPCNFGAYVYLIALFEQSGCAFAIFFGALTRYGIRVTMRFLTEPCAQ
jgi:hypothetical protein